MRKFKTERRLQRLTEAAESRQATLRLILENIHDPHNVSAIYRTCDATGVQNVGLVYTNEEFPKISRVTSSSANKWIDTQRYKSVEECCDELHKQGFKVYASTLEDNAVDFYQLDLTEPVALVVGNEHRGISDELKNLADKTFFIPMRGMVQSLNVSVASAVILYEAQRQRSLKGMYSLPSLPQKELDNLIDKWCDK
ncbi:MAG: tRNA guanosine-2'-O-methyltransferase [Ignavibacteria bacterium]|nr:MAG: tRNA guanosine-2'-O-methyltransferase [Ignavibacteria bacterium]KAF0161349.1 MAG: tRNA guanosine-2'-O-methyltransferase [Ignavibacteria bacterium]